MALKAAGDLHNEKRARILSIIDKIRELGVSESVSLPQLVVVGDQSSGKSSLLEGLTGLSFPVASDLCTRFATQIVLRRTPAGEAGAKITIIPGPAAQTNQDLEKKLKGFEKVLGEDQFGSDEFGKVFDEAAAVMGIPGPSTTELENIDKRFSDDILKIELSGPGHNHLSVVDVPGLFHNPTKYQTEEDKAIIRGLIESYITDKRTIILAVMDARNNLANQGVFSMARAADPVGKRTVGIITKCDAVEEGDEAGVIRIAKNQVERLTHGWFAVKNRSTKDIEAGVTIEGRHRREIEFFSGNAPWTQLPKDRVGIRPLKKFLGGLLYDHIRSEFPNVVKDIGQSLSEAEGDLNLLGPSRQTTIDQRRFMNRLVSSYQMEVDNALGGNYDPELNDESPLKLRMHVQNLNDEFALTITIKGHEKVFHKPSGGEDSEYMKLGSSRSGGEDIYAWIRRVYRASRGTELPGTVNPRILERLFRQQSSPWQELASTHVLKVRDAVRAFNNKLLHTIVRDEEVRERLAGHLKRVEEATMSTVDTEFARVLGDERQGILQTVNHYYADTLANIRDERVRARLRGMGLEDETRKAVNVGDVMKRIHLSNEDQAVYDIHDCLKAYYKVALKRFADNIVIQIVERYILGQNGPVRALNADMVNELDEGELLEIAGESFVTASMRNDLAGKVQRFQEALAIAKQAGA
ncbi:dynamin family protein [Aspergillus stella-maris]|uniref:dynamin family protein n=1 Tax=Aspergillus stella-maris TaxID=1810926 RepID=UPI003CCE4897